MKVKKVCNSYKKSTCTAGDSSRISEIGYVPWFEVNRESTLPVEDIDRAVWWGRFRKKEVVKLLGNLSSASEFVLIPLALVCELLHSVK